MRDNRTLKITILVILGLTVVGLAIGFAAFSATLNISTFNATTKAGSEEANFSSLVTFQNDAKCTSASGATATAGTATGHTWSGISLSFTKPSQSVTCTAKIKNSSNYKAYFWIFSSKNVKLTCTGDATNKDEVCKGIYAIVSADFGGSSLPYTLTIKSDSISASSYRSERYLNPNSSVVVTWDITYADGSAIPDDNVTVNIPAVSALFKTTTK